MTNRTKSEMTILKTSEMNEQNNYIEENVPEDERKREVLGTQSES